VADVERFALELSLGVVEGATHNLGSLMLWCWLRANTYNPLGPRPECVVLHRGEGSWSPPAVREPAVSNEQVGALVGRLRSLGWPARELRVSVVESPLAGTQEVRFRVWLDGQERELRLALQYAGLDGPDADGLRGVFRSITELAGLPDQERWIAGTWQQEPA